MLRTAFADGTHDGGDHATIQQTNFTIQKTQYPFCERKGNYFVMKVHESCLQIPITNSLKSLRKEEVAIINDRFLEITSPSCLETNKDEDVPLEDRISPYTVRFHPLYLTFDHPEYEAVFKQENSRKLFVAMQRSLMISVLATSIYTISSYFAGNSMLFRVYAAFDTFFVIFLIATYWISKSRYEDLWAIAVTALYFVTTFDLSFDSSTEISIPPILVIMLSGSSIRARMTTYLKAMCLPFIVMMSWIPSRGIWNSFLLGIFYTLISLTFALVNYFFERSDRITFLETRKGYLKQKLMSRHKRKTRDILDSIYPREVSRSLISKASGENQSYYQVSSNQADVVYALKQSISEVKEKHAQNDDFRLLEACCHLMGFEKIVSTEWAMMFVGNLFPSQQTHVQTFDQVVHSIEELFRKQSNRGLKQSLRIGLSQGCATGFVNKERMKPLALIGEAVTKAQNPCMLFPASGIYVDKMSLGINVRERLKGITMECPSGSGATYEFFAFSENEVQNIQAVMDEEVEISFEPTEAGLPNLAQINNTNELDGSINILPTTTKEDEEESDDLTEAEKNVAHRKSKMRGIKESNLVIRSFCIYLAVVINTWGFMHSAIFWFGADLTDSPLELSLYRFAIFSPLFTAVGVYFVLGIHLDDTYSKLFRFSRELPAIMVTLYAIYVSSFFVFWTEREKWICIRDPSQSFVSLEVYLIQLWAPMCPTHRMSFKIIFHILWIPFMAWIRYRFIRCTSSLVDFFSGLFGKILLPYIALAWSVHTIQKMSILQKKALLRAQQEIVAIAKIQERMQNIIIGLVPENIYEKLQNGLALESFDAKNVAFILIHFTHQQAKSFRNSLQNIEGVAEVSEVEEDFASRKWNDLLEMIDSYAKAMKIEPIKAVGDCYLLWCGWDGSVQNPTSIAADFCISMQALLMSEKFRRKNKIDFRMCIGAGSCRYGFVGQDRLSFDVWGSACDEALQSIRHCDLQNVLISPEAYRQIFNDRRYAFEKAGDVSLQDAKQEQCYHIRNSNDIWEAIVSTEISIN
eukprot:TRINITY_DN3290_c0_g1_i5.p1 TRINITY_DN3290_c0_g1~~TRINITY_DN3290_c0_g1_i5.p1  ORF type:complete len:1032 (+),score=189.71 TRINITY_DN3290_c0_g1_i5:107-3202(+)